VGHAKIENKYRIQYLNTATAKKVWTSAAHGENNYETALDVGGA